MAALTIDENKVGHIFRDAEGHFREDTDANRRLLMKKKLLSPERAFRAMFIFLNEYHRRTVGTAELGDVLGDIQLNESDGMPADPAAWGDWLAAIDEARDHAVEETGKAAPRRNR